MVRVYSISGELQRRIAASPGCRKLTPLEIERLRGSKREFDQVAGAVFEAMQDESQI